MLSDFMISGDNWCVLRLGVYCGLGLVCRRVLVAACFVASWALGLTV